MKPAMTWVLRHPLARLSILGAVVVSLGACVTSEATKQAVFAPQLRKYDQNEIKDTMARLADGVQNIDALLRTNVRDDETKRKVLGHLNDMEAAAKELTLQGRDNVSHPLFDNYLENLRERLIRARFGVERDPPDYFLVGNIAGSCLACHQTRRATGAAGKRAAFTPVPPSSPFLLTKG